MGQSRALLHLLVPTLIQDRIAGVHVGIVTSGVFVLWVSVLSLSSTRLFGAFVRIVFWTSSIKQGHVVLNCWRKLKVVTALCLQFLTVAFNAVVLRLVVTAWTVVTSLTTLMMDQCIVAIA